MKKIASILLVFLALMSCTQEITRNNPSLQGLKDGVLWRANDSFAILYPSGSLTITGLTQFETVTLTTNSPLPQTYTLGTSNARQASYSFIDDTQVLEFSTGVDVGDGIIIIKEYDEANHTISGEFRFNAENLEDNPDEPEIVNYQYGVFYKIPVTPGI